VTILHSPLSTLAVLISGNGSNLQAIVGAIQRDDLPASVEVDAYPGERFEGHVSRIAPVFDPATRTAEMEIEVPNPGFRLKPGMYARVQLRVAERPDALTVPRNALVEFGGQRGVFVPRENVAQFVPVETGLQDLERVEILSGLEEQATVISTGAAGLRDGDPILLADAPGGRSSATPARRGGRGEGGPRGGRGGAEGAPSGRDGQRPPQASPPR